MKKKRAHLFLGLGLSAALIFIILAIISQPASDDPSRWKFYRPFPLKWEGPAENASSSALDIETYQVTEHIELDLAGEPSTPTPRNQDVSSPTIETVTAIADGNANCRSGPNMVFQTISFLKEGDQLIVLARSIGNDWLLVLIPTSGTECWVWQDLLTVKDHLDGLPEIPGPPLPLITSTAPTKETAGIGCWVENDPQYPNGICKPLPCGPNDFPATECDLP